MRDSITTLGDTIKRLRAAKGWSQRELARRMQVTSGAVGQWEVNATVPETARLIELTRLFEVSLADLLGSSLDSKSIDAQLVELPDHVRDVLLRSFQAQIAAVRNLKKPE